MSNLRNRFLALAIVVVMLVAALSSTAFAATSTVFSDISDADQTKMVKLLGALQIVLGRGEDEDGSQWFDTDGLVTRQEMAMFLARINSATPGAFNDKEASAAVKLPYTDVKDSTFFLAIEYCYQQGIILGATADTYNPTDTVTLDQALAMIVRALGYKDIDTSKNFIESTKKAKELGFALSYKDNEGSKKLTRIEVIELLYKYFYSDEQSLEVVKNETTGVQVTQRVPHPVMEKFGINVQDAYIVRSGDYTATMSTATLESPNGDKLTLPKMDITRQLTARELADGYDVILAYNNFRVVSTSASNTEDGRIKNGYTYSGKWTYIPASKADFGIEKTETDRNLVGLKVTYYQDTMEATRPEPLNITSDVIGTKTQVDLADKTNPTSAKMKDDLKDFSDYSKALTILGKTYDLTASVKELQDSDIYQYNGTTNLAAAPATTDYKTLKQLGGFIAKGGNNFGLEYVDNGEGEEFFIFTPYSAGYYVEDKRPGDSDDNKDWAYRRFLNGNREGADGEVEGNKTWYFQNPDSSLNIVLKFYADDVTAIEKTNAYLYTREGKYLNIFAKLVKRVDSKYPDYIYSGSMSLSGNVISVSDKNNKIALGATTTTSSFGVGAKHSAFSVTATSDIFFVVRLEDIPGATSNRKYGVLTSAPTSVANYLNNGQYMYMYPVFTYADNRVMSMTSEILISDYDYWNTRKLEAGDLVSYQKVGDYYRMGAFDADSYLYMSGNGHADYRTAGLTGGYINSNSVMKNFSTITPSYDYLSSNILYMNSAFGRLGGIITSNTEILLTQYNSADTFTPEKFVSGRKLTKAEFDNLWSKLGTGRYAQYTMEMVTEYNTSISNALTVHVRVQYNAADNNDMYATVYELLGSNDAYYSSVTTMAKAYNYINGTEYLVAAASGAALKVGEVVRISPDRYSTVNNTTYWLVSRISTPPVRYGAATPASDNRGYFTQPYNDIRAWVESWRGNITLDTLAYRLSNNYNLWAYPIQTSSRGGAVYGGLTTGSSSTYTAISPIDLWSRTVVREVTNGTAWSLDTTYTPVTLIAKTEAALDTVPTGSGGFPAAGVVGSSGDVRYVWASTTTTDALGITTVTANAPAKRILTKAYASTSTEPITNANDINVIVDASVEKFVEIGTTGMYYVNASSDSAEALFEEGVDNDYLKTTTSSSTYDAVSLLNRNKVNYVTITLPKNSSTAGGSTLPADTTFEYGRKDWDGIPVITNGSGNNTLSNSTNLYRYYVITNNTDETKYSDIVTIIEIKVAS